MGDNTRTYQSNQEWVVVYVCFDTWWMLKTLGGKSKRSNKTIYCSSDELLCRVFFDWDITIIIITIIIITRKLHLQANVTKKVIILHNPSYRL